MEYEAGLGHGAFEGIHEQEHPVGHVEHAFDLATEVAVAGSVNDVDFVVFVTDGHVLGEDGDSPFPFEVVAVHDQFAGVFVVFEQTPGHDHFVYQGRFTVVDVRNNSNVSQVHVAFLNSAAKVQLFFERKVDLLRGVSKVGKKSHFFSHEGFLRESNCLR